MDELEIKLSNKTPAPARELIIELLQKGASTEAESLCRQILASAPFDFETLFFLAHSLKLQYRFKDAISALKQAAKLSNATEILVFLTEMLYRVGCVDEARSLIKNLRIDSPNDLNLAELEGKIIGRAESGVGCRLELKDLISLNDAGSNINLCNKQEFIPVYSAKGEQRIIDDFCKYLRNYNNYVVDIGAGDGFTFSNSLDLIKSKGWDGLLIEPDKSKAKLLTDLHSSFVSKIRIVSDYITPPRVIDMFRAFEVPFNFGFLSLDVDSIEYPLLQTILSNYRPGLICVEINERVKPGVEYYTQFIPGAALPFAPLFLGVSITSAYNLLKAFDYCPFHLEYNNLFATPRENSINITSNTYDFSKSDLDIFEFGFAKRIDSLSSFPWNESFLKLHQLSAKDFCENWVSLINEHKLEMAYFMRFPH